MEPVHVIEAVHYAHGGAHLCISRGCRSGRFIELAEKYTLSPHTTCRVEHNGRFVSVEPHIWPTFFLPGDHEQDLP